MDEADVLGDRIGIMAKGKLMCLGSSLFLKNRFSAGIKVTMVKKSKDLNKQVSRFLATYFSEFELLSEIATEMTYLLPNRESSAFTDFFTEFDKNLDKLGISSYGVSITTLEEVFLKINEELAPDLFKTERNESVR